MVSNSARRIVMALVRLKIWKAEIGMFRVVDIRSSWGTRWLHRMLLRQQKVDNWHHAPCCPANHWCRQRLVFSRCNCGADPSLAAIRAGRTKGGE